MFKISILDMSFESTNLRLQPLIPGVNELSRNCILTSSYVYMHVWRYQLSKSWFWKLSQALWCEAIMSALSGHYSDVIMSIMASQITILTIVYGLFKLNSQKTSKLRVTGLCEGNSLVTGASNAENVSIWWCHHVICAQHNSWPDERDMMALEVRAAGTDVIFLKANYVTNGDFFSYDLK